MKIIISFFLLRLLVNLCNKNCISCDSKDNCLLCKEGTYIDINNIENPSECIYPINKIKDCIEYNYYNIKECLKCKPGKLLYNNNCNIKCNENCYECYENPNNCIVCENYVPSKYYNNTCKDEDKSNNYENCKYNLLYTYKDINNNIVNIEDCLECINGFSLVYKNNINKCLKMVKLNCIYLKYISEYNFECLKCKKGYWMNNKQQCNIFTKIISLLILVKFLLIN